MKSKPKPPEHPPIPLKSLFSIPPCNTNNSTMTNEGPEPSNLTTQHHHHLLDWLEDSITFLPSFLDDPYAISDEITGDEWWTPDLDQSNLIQTPVVSVTPADHTTASIDSPPLPQPELSKKRKLPANPNPTHHQRRRITAETANENDGEHGDEGEVQRKPLNGRKAQGKGNGGGSGNGGSKDVRWAEQLLNPCAVAIDAGNVSRVQHLLYVLHELASPSGDANHRLAAHGLRVLTHHLSSAGAGAGIGIPAAPTAPSFPSTEPRLFRSALIRFNEVSPWFAFPNSLANSSILQAAAPDPNQRPRALHVVDVGVSHGVQWPTLLEALTRRNGGAPSLVRLTVAGSAAPPAPFSAAPPGYDFPTHLLRYARSIDLNLQIDRANTLEARALSVTSDETLVVCIQFRAHQLGQGGGDADSFFRSVRELGPDLVVLSEIDGGSGGGFAAGFGRRAELLWRFLDSTSAAFKGRDCVERRVLEGEAARMLEEELTAVEGRERLRERMIGAGFREEGFGEEAVDAGRALLRKYDGNWEMRAAAEAAEAAVGLWWKGQPVSFCSLWKPIKKAAGGQQSP